MKKAYMLLLLSGCLLLPVYSQSDCTKPQKVKHYLSFGNAEALQEYLQWKEGCKPIVAAHRGGPLPDYPENCLETFDHMMSFGPCLIECDVRKSKDGKLIMMHDKTLERTTNGKGKVEDFTLAELKKLNLKDPNGKIIGYKMPTFGEVLDWARNKTVLEIDVKKPVTPEEIVAAIKKHNAENCSIVITYNLNDAKKYHKLNPHLMISASARNMREAEKLIQSGINPRKLIAFTGISEPRKEVYQYLHKNGIRAILGTLGNLDKMAQTKGIKVYLKFLENGADILATDDVPFATKAVNKFIAEKK